MMRGTSDRELASLYRQLNILTRLNKLPLGIEGKDGGAKLQHCFLELPSELHDSSRSPEQELDSFELFHEVSAILKGKLKYRPQQARKKIKLMIRSKPDDTTEPVHRGSQPEGATPAPNERPVNILRQMEQMLDDAENQSSNESQKTQQKLDELCREAGVEYAEDDIDEPVTNVLFMNFCAASAAPLDLKGELQAIVGAVDSGEVKVRIYRCSDMSVEELQRRLLQSASKNRNCFHYIISAGMVLRKV